MNAADKALGIDLATKIAGTVTLFTSVFPAARADLRPWAADADTRSLVDPDSIDLSFSFPGVNRRIPSRCLLVQIRLFEGRAVEVACMNIGLQELKLGERVWAKRLVTCRRQGRSRQG